jgi:hypothetical protein
MEDLMKMKWSRPCLQACKNCPVPLGALIEFLEIDEDLVEVAAQASNPLAAGPGRRELSAWIRGLPEKDKNELLVTAGVESGRALAKRLSCGVSGVRDVQQPSDRSRVQRPGARCRRYLLAAAHARAKERARLLNERRVA